MMPTKSMQAMPYSEQLGDGSVGNHEKEVAQKARTRLSLARRICNMLGDNCGIAPDTVLLSKIAMWAQGRAKFDKNTTCFRCRILGKTSKESRPSER